jgi:hypothetical protein
MKRTSRKPSRLSESLQRILNSYALAASAAGVGILALVQPSNAKVIYTPAQKRLPLNQDFFLDLNHDGTNDFEFHISASGKFLPPSATGGEFACLSVSAQSSANGMVGYEKNGLGAASALRAGSSIGSKRHFVGRSVNVALAGVETIQGMSGYFGLWENGGKGVRRRYLGVKFLINGATHYGWARMNVRAYFDNNGLATVHALLTGYAYETIPNKPIIAGKTTGLDVVTIQPASLGHLAQGAAAMPAWRFAAPVQ